MFSFFLSFFPPPFLHFQRAFSFFFPPADVPTAEGENIKTPFVRRAYSDIAGVVPIKKKCFCYKHKIIVQPIEVGAREKNGIRHFRPALHASW